MIRLNFFPLIKQDPFSVAAAGVGGLLGLASGALSSHQQQVNTRENMLLQHSLNKNEMNHSMQLQKSQQEWLMDHQYAKTVAGMKNAGLNPAIANGVSPSVPSGGSPSSGGSGPSGAAANYDIVGGMSAGLAVQNQMTQNKIAEEDLTRKRIENRLLEIDKLNKEAEYGEYNTKTDYNDPDTGAPIIDVDTWMKEHPGKIPNTNITKLSGNEGKLRARWQKSEYGVLESEQRARSAVARSTAFIESGKLDPEYKRAVLDMPKQEHKRIIQLIEREGIEKAMLKIEQEEQKFSKFSAMLKYINDPQMSRLDKIGVALMYIANRFVSLGGRR